jgi:zinc protease
MRQNRTNLLSKAALSFIISTTILAGTIWGAGTTYRLDNGMEVILKETHASPMVAGMVFVKSGSKYESRFENGITHFLEHLLFNGTVNRSREEIDGSIRDLGGYLNAFTRKDLTSYFVLMPKQHIDYGLVTMADMLFNSTIPENELLKERQVVIEEIKRSADSPGWAAEKFFTEKAFAGTNYDRPVLGYQSFVENIPRAAIIDYWKRYYRPDNMMLLIIGDFETATMKKTIATIYGSIESGDPKPAPIGDDIQPNIEGQQVFDTVADVSSTYINFSFAAPHFNDSSYLPFDLLVQYYGMEGASPLLQELTEGAAPLATETGIYLNTKGEFSRLELSIITEKPENVDTILAVVPRLLRQASGHEAEDETIAGIITSVKCHEIYNSEKLHYLGFMIAPMLMTAGWDFVENYGTLLSQVSWDQARQAAAEWLDDPNYIATVVRPRTDSTQTPFVPEGLTAEEVIAHFDQATIPEHDVTTGQPLVYPEPDSVKLELSDPAEYHRVVLPNGLTVIIKSSPDSRVFGVSLLGKNRNGNEPVGKAGITDFVNHCLEKGTINRDASELSRDLAEIGANLTLYDNPWIPYDDHYTTRRFAFAKFETIDEYAREGFELFSELVLQPAFDSLEMENVRASLMGSLGRSGASARKVARNLFYATLLGEEPYGQPVMGTARSIGSITRDDLVAHHARFYSPENMILSIGANLPIDTILSWVQSRFGQIPAAEVVSAFRAQPPVFTEIREDHSEMEAKQISMYLGSFLPAATSDEVPALSIATSILSRRLYLNLREKQGLAYSVGAGSTYDRDFGWMYCVMGTSHENYQKALDGIILEIDKLKLDGPTHEEINTARNQIWGSLGRARLSRVNQAYWLAVNEYLRRQIGHDQMYLKALGDVTPDAVRRVTARYFNTDAYVLASAGKKE